MIEKKEIKKFDKEVQQLIPIVSEFFYDIELSSSVNYKSYSNFFKHRDSLRTYKDNYYLILCGHSPNSDLVDNIFITFNSTLNKQIVEREPAFKDVKVLKRVYDKFKLNIISQYSYQYIPVETSLNEFLRLESKGMQDLMSENIKERIENILIEKLPIEAGRTKKQSLLDIVNNDLEAFVDNVAKTIQCIDEKYDFEKEYKAKTKLTANHLTDIIVESFFSKRKLKRDSKPIENLSAGERKKALIDIAYAFLTQDEKSNQNIILAIDEPESSLHISMCYDQFNRLQELAKNYNVQLFIATHWYGALPIIDDGVLHHINSQDSDSTDIKQFSFSNYFSDRKGHPDDIQFKSYFDLVSSVISSLRLQEYNWMIVESEDDKKYIAKHLPDHIKNRIKFLPVGSSSVVSALYSYLYTPLFQGHDKKSFKGKVLCLIDTDIKGVNFLSEKSDIDGLLRIRRLQLDKGDIRLATMDCLVHYPTEIEEALIPEKFYEALSLVIAEKGDDLIRGNFSLFEFDSQARNSFIKGDDSIIYPSTEVVGNPKYLKDQIYEFINSHKRDICNAYCHLEISEKPKWINQVIEYFE